VINTDFKTVKSVKSP